MLLHLTQRAYLPVPGSTCGIPPLNSEVVATPTKAAYQIGDRVSLSCPVGSVLDGAVSCAVPVFSGLLHQTALFVKPVQYIYSQYQMSKSFVP